MSQPKPKRDLHAEITHALISAIEKNPGEPVMPWRRTGGKPLWLLENALSKKRYNGINVVSLWAAAESKGFSAPIWAIYRQWAELGCQVRGGERASLVIFYKEYTAEALWRSEVHCGRTRGRDRQRDSVRRARHHPGRARRSCAVPGTLAQIIEG
jgi:antirestriction protein ArdC